MRFCAVLISGILITGCTAIQPQATPLPSATPISLDYLDSLRENDILIQHDIGIGFNYDLTHLAPRFVLYANGSMIYSKELDNSSMRGLYQTTLSDQQVRELMGQLYQLGVENIQGYNYEQGCFTNTSAGENLFCATDSYDETFRIRLGKYAVHTAIAYNGNQPMLSKLDDAIQLLNEYQSDTATLYQAVSSTVLIIPQEPYLSDLPIVVDWPLPHDFQSENSWHRNTIDAEQTAELVEIVGTNLTGMVFVSGERRYWGFLLPDLPGIEYPDY